MKGVGRSTVMGPLVEVPVAYSYGQAQHVVLARVMEDDAMSQGVVLLVGTTIQSKMIMVMDVENHRVELRAIREVARLESLEVIENRKLYRPIKVLDLCADVSGAYCTLSDLGFKIVLLGKTSLHKNHEFKARGVCKRAPMWRDNPS